MVSVNRKLICTIIDSSQIHTASSLRSSLVVLPNSKNMGIAVEMSLLSCIQAEMYAIPYLRPVMAANFDSSQIHKSGSFAQRSRRVARLQNMAINNCWKFVAISPGSGDIDTSGLEAAILDSPHPVWSESALVSFDCWTSKM